MRGAKATVGVDLSKEYFTAYLLSRDEEISAGPKNFQRDRRGLKEFKQWVEGHGFRAEDVIVVTESTNNYWETVAVKLFEEGFRVSVVNPRVIKDFGRSLQRKTKTDAIDAEVIALYGVRMKPRQWDRSRYEKMLRLRHLVRTREFLLRERLRLRNHLDMLKGSEFAPEEAIKVVEGSLREIERGIEETEEKIKEEIRADKEIEEGVRILRSIPGIGVINALVILSEAKGFEGFSRSREVVSYAGICPRVEESGKRRVDKGITREGNRRLRTAAYFAAMASLRHRSKVFRSYYERLLSRGKSKKAALMALGGKILRISFALVKKGEVFTPELCMSR
ncbi:MAG: IS110 family transposase [Nitrospirae bacterium]|nr:MAG: IS110 family transposase [Nitrospirota bacterium]